MQLDWRRDSCSWLEVEPKDIKNTGNVSHKSQQFLFSAFIEIRASIKRLHLIFRQAASSSGKLRIYVPKCPGPNPISAMYNASRCMGSSCIAPCTARSSSWWSHLVVAHAFCFCGFLTIFASFPIFYSFSTFLDSLHIFFDVWVFSQSSRSCGLHCKMPLLQDNSPFSKYLVMVAWHFLSSFFIASRRPMPEVSRLLQWSWHLKLFNERRTACFSLHRYGCFMDTRLVTSSLSKASRRVYAMVVKGCNKFKQIKKCKGDANAECLWLGRVAQFYRKS